MARDGQLADPEAAGQCAKAGAGATLAVRLGSKVDTRFGTPLKARVRVVPGEDPQVQRTLFTQLMLERGFLATGAFYATLAHTDEHVDSYLAAVRESFAIIAEALAQGTLHQRLHGPVAHTGFFRLA